jgi:hypothetical protein
MSPPPLTHNHFHHGTGWPFFAQGSLDFETGTQFFTLAMNVSGDLWRIVYATITVSCKCEHV